MNITRIVVDHPKTVILLCLIPVLAAAVSLPRLVQDIRSDAFLAEDHPALVYKRKVKEQFGLSDPIVVAIVDKSPAGVFNAKTLGLIRSLTERITALPGIDSSGVVSLATEKNIAATADGMDISLFYENVPVSEPEIQALREAVFDFPLYVGNLVSRDGSVTLVIAEMLDELKAGQNYRDVVDIVERATVPEDVELYVAGEGAIIGYLGSYVDADARQLVPFSGVIITLVLVIAYRGIVAALLTNVLVLATLVITMGVMAVSGVPFYVITNALPVILIGISVADAIHIYLHFFDLQRLHPAADGKSLVVETIATMWRPMTLTSLTTIAGFLGLYFSGYMPPFVYFGLFAAIGVAVAWFYSMTLLPAMMVLTGAHEGRRNVAAQDTSRKTPVWGLLLGWLGDRTYSNAPLIVVCYTTLALCGLVASSLLVVDENPINVFNPKERIVLADQIINRHLNGSNTLDIVVKTPAPEDLFLPENLRKMESLQAFVETLPMVGGSVSIVDYLKQMNRSLNGGAAAEYRLPGDRETVAQYFLLYSATSDPTDFEEEVDYDYMTANIRVFVRSGDYQDVKVIVEALLGYLEGTFNDENIEANLSGRVNVHYRWIGELAHSHFVGVAVAISLVLIVSALLFRSVVAGLLTLLPVAFAVLLIYVIMATTGITMGMGTSMFATVAIGLGIDYAIHTVERMRVIYSETGQDLKAAFREFYPGTGRALFFNFVAIACGFSVLTLSKISSLNIFGAIVAVAVCASFVASMTLLPALVKVLLPAFMRRPNRVAPRGLPLGLGFVFVAVTLTLLHSAPGKAADEIPPDRVFNEALPGSSAPRGGDLVDNGRLVDEAGEAALTAGELVARINSVPEGQTVSREIEMQMTDRRGKQRSRRTISFRKSYADQKKTVLFYLEPSNVRGTGFLIWDYISKDDSDDQWLYLPALRKVRRISASDRGDYFLGTDFTYEDIKLDGKLEPRDYEFTLLGEEQVDGLETFKLEAIPKNNDIARELGYSRTVVWADPANWMIQRAEFWDVKGELLKTLTVSGIRQVSGIWTRHGLKMVNHQSGHTTRFEFSNVDYTSPIDDEFFTRTALERGL